MFYITNKFFIRSLFAVNILLLCSFSGFSQFRVKGKISDEKGESLVGVNVMVKNTSAGTLSGIDGNYTIEVTNNQSVLVFSCKFRILDFMKRFICNFYAKVTYMFS